MRRLYIAGENGVFLGEVNIFSERTRSFSEARKRNPLFCNSSINAKRSEFEFYSLFIESLRLFVAMFMA